MTTVPSQIKATGSAVSTRSACADDLTAIVQVHLSAFHSGFTLSALGPKFLYKYYRQVLCFDEGLLLVAEVEGKIVGFVAGFTDPRRFYQTLARHKWQFAIPALRAIPRHPHLLLRGWSLVRRVIRPMERLADASQASCELSSAAVRPEAAGQGIGQALVRAFVDAARAKNASGVSLTTDAVNNEDVNRFYRRLGFRLHRTFQASSGRFMNEYMLDLPE